MNILYVIVGLLLLVFGGNYLVKASVGFSFKLNISKMVIGITVVSFATSAPELLVSIQAALDDSPAIAINNVIGSNIANIGLVLGVTAFIGSINISKDFYKLNWPVMMVFSILIYYFLKNDNQLTFNEGFILFLGLIIFLIILIKFTKKENSNNDEVDAKLATVGYAKIVAYLLIGIASLYFGSDLLIKGAKSLAENLGVSEGIISITMIAIGTSIPELVASMVAIVKGEKAISLGNLIGSNIFNIASVLGLTAMIKTIPITELQILARDIYWMLSFTFIILPLVFIPEKFKLNRLKGAILFLGYCTFIYSVFI